MKSRTSFFNGVIFRKNMTRFAPVWGLYTLCLLLGMLLMLDRNIEYWFAANLASMCSGMAIVNLGYALVVALVLFGDLYNTRMCHALHAMPLRRECWFTTHVISGMVFSLLPTAIMAAASEVFLANNPTMADGWQIPLYFFAAANLEYLFFFALAVFAVMCSGNRLAMALTYSIVNFASYIAYFLIDTLIRPMYYGAVSPAEIFLLLCPVANICQIPLVVCQRDRNPATNEFELSGTFYLDEGWLYIGILAVLGLALLLIARQMYRRRKLECAGDFLATSRLAPVFMVVFPIVVGTVFQFVPGNFFSIGYNWDFPVFLYVGLAVGWFAGRMLLERQTKVFGSLKNWLGYLALTAAVVGSLYGLSLDPFGVEDYVPSVEDVQSATMRDSYRGEVKTEDPAEIQDIITIQRGILKDKLTAEEGSAGIMEAYIKAVETSQPYVDNWSMDEIAEKFGYRKYTSIDITYELKNGWTVCREYWMWTDTDAAALAKPYLSSLEALFHNNMEIRTAEDLLALVRAPRYLYVDNCQLPEEYLTAENVRSFFEAVIADCAAGNMVQTDGFHEGAVVDTPERYSLYYPVEMDLVEEGLYFTIYADSENCMAWMEETGIRDYVMGHRDQLG